MRLEGSSWTKSAIGSEHGVHRVRIDVQANDATGPTKVLRVSDEPTTDASSELALLRRRRADLRALLLVSARLRRPIESWLRAETERAQHLAVSHAEEEARDAGLSDIAVRLASPLTAAQSYTVLPPAFVDGKQLAKPYCEQEARSYLRHTPEELVHELLFVQAVGAMNLPVADINGFSDPFVAVELVPTARGEQQQRKETRTATRTLDPVWGEAFHFSLAAGRIAIERTARLAADSTTPLHLRITVFDSDRTQRPEVLGEVLVDVSALARDAMSDRWFPLTFARGSKLRPRGSVHLRILRTPDIARQRLAAAARIVCTAEADTRALLARVEHCYKAAKTRAGLGGVEESLTSSAQEDFKLEDVSDDSLALFDGEFEEAPPPHPYSLHSLVQSVTGLSHAHAQSSLRRRIAGARSAAVVRLLRTLTPNASPARTAESQVSPHWRNGANPETASERDAFDAAAAAAARIPLALLAPRRDQSRRVIGLQLRVDVISAENLALGAAAASEAPARVYCSLACGQVMRRTPVVQAAFKVRFSAQQHGGPLRPAITVKPTAAASEALEIASVNTELLAGVVGDAKERGALRAGQYVSVVNGVCLRMRRFEEALGILSAAFIALECCAAESIELLVTCPLVSGCSLEAHFESSILFGALVPPPVALGTHVRGDSPLDPCVSLALFARGAQRDSSSHSAEAHMLGSDFVTLDPVNAHDSKKRQRAEALLVPRAALPTAITPANDVAVGTRAYVSVPYPGEVIDRWFVLDCPRGPAGVNDGASSRGVSLDKDVDRGDFESSQKRGHVYAAAARMSAGSSCPLSLMRSRLSAPSSESVKARAEAATDVEQSSSSSATAETFGRPRVRLRISWVPLFVRRQQASSAPAKIDQAQGGTDVLTADTRRVRAVVGGVSISLIDAQPREILLLTVSRLRALLNQGALQRIELDVGRLQLDCQLPFTAHPVVLAPAAKTIEARRAAKRARRHAAAERVRAAALRASFAAAAANERASMAAGSNSALLGGSRFPPPYFDADSGDALSSVDSDELPTLSVLLITSPHPVITYVCSRA